MAIGDEHEIVRELADIVSKNGNMLLNVPPKPDGTLDQATEDILAAIGKWLAVNGEAIYETRPWRWIRDHDDVRFTTKGDALYTIVVAWPEGGELTVPALGLCEKPGAVKRITMLGAGDAPLAFRQEERALCVTLPADKPCEHAWSLKLEMQA